MSKPVISVNNLIVQRGKKAILVDISFQVPKGKVVGLIGPSGSGKTTLMRAILGAQKFQSGGVAVLGKPAGNRELRSQVGYMAQVISVYNDLSVIENLRYFGRLLGTTAKEAERVLELVELTEQRKQVVATLSGGQQARVSLAVALLGTPPVLILDEPTVGLDPLLRQKLWALFAKLAQSGTTLLVSSHVMDEAVRCGDLLLLRGGRLIAEGSVDSLLKQAKAKDLEEAFIKLAKKQREAAHV